MFNINMIIQYKKNVKSHTQHFNFSRRIIFKCYGYAEVLTNNRIELDAFIIETNFLL